MDFVFILITASLAFWLGKIYSRTELRMSENELLDEVRKLCNELLKIKDKGTIVITKLSMSKTKGPNRVEVTTLPKEDLNKKKSEGKQITNLEVDKVVLVSPANVPKGCEFKKVSRKKKER